MSVDPKFREASEAAALWLNDVALVVMFGQGPKRNVDEAYKILMPTERIRYSLQTSYDEHADILHKSFSALAMLSDGPVEMPHGWGISGISRGKNGVYPHCWSSAHEAATGIAELALRFFADPLVGVNDPTEQWKIAERLLKQRCKALVMSEVEIARLQERIRRERAKLLSKSGDDPETSEVSLMDQVLSVVTPNQSHIMEYLLNKKTASYDTLRTIPRAWRDEPSDEAITKQLKTMKSKLEAANLPVGYIKVSSAKRRVTLEPNKSGY